MISKLAKNICGSLFRSVVGVLPMEAAKAARDTTRTAYTLRSATLLQLLGNVCNPSMAYWHIRSTMVADSMCKQ